MKQKKTQSNPTATSRLFWWFKFYSLATILAVFMSFMLRDPVALLVSKANVSNEKLHASKNCP